MERFVITLLITFILTATGATVRNCTFPGDFCRIDAQSCLEYTSGRRIPSTDVPRVCKHLSHVTVYRGTDDVHFSARTSRGSWYRDQIFTVTMLNKYNGIRTHVEGCCNIKFGEYCNLKREGVNGIFAIHAMPKRGMGKRYCYMQIYEEPRRTGITEWCCSNFINMANFNSSCTVDFPCMAVNEVNEVVMRSEYRLISIDSYSKSYYCFFEAPKEYTSGKEIANSNLVYGIQGITVNATLGEVSIGDSKLSCNRKEIVNLPVSSYHKEFVWKAGRTWCFIIKSIGNKHWSNVPTCFKYCEECIDNQFNVVAVIVPLIVALILALFVIWMLNKQIGKIIMYIFPDKQEIENDIPNTTKEVFRVSDSEMGEKLIDKEIPDAVVCEGEEEDVTDIRIHPLSGEECGENATLCPPSDEEIFLDLSGKELSDGEKDADARARIDSGFEGESLPAYVIEVMPVSDGYTSRDPVLDELRGSLASSEEERSEEDEEEEATENKDLALFTRVCRDGCNVSNLGESVTNSVTIHYRPTESVISPPEPHSLPFLTTDLQLKLQNDVRISDEHVKEFEHDFRHARPPSHIPQSQYEVISGCDQISNICMKQSDSGYVDKRDPTIPGFLDATDFQGFDDNIAENETNSLVAVNITKITMREKSSGDLFQLKEENESDIEIPNQTMILGMMTDELPGYVTKSEIDYVDKHAIIETECLTARRL